MNQTKPIVAVLGLGRFGSFWASLLATEFNVIAWSRNSKRAAPEGVRRVEYRELFDAEAIFLCNSISSMESVAKDLAGQVKPGTVVLDTCSVKIYPLSALETHLPGDIEIIGTHPMFGPDSAKKGSAGLPVVLSSYRQSKNNYSIWKKRFELLGLKVLEMSAEEHDREAAYTQGVTHFIGRMLSEMGLQPSEMATSGYSTLQKIMRETCNDPWQLFEDLQRFNPYTGLMRKDLNCALGVMMKRFDSIEEPPVTATDSSGDPIFKKNNSGNLDCEEVMK